MQTTTIILIIASAAALFIAFRSAPVHREAVQCAFVRNYDGDTITVNIPQWPAIVGQEIDVRIAGIDTPEIRTRKPAEKKRAIAAKETVFRYCRNARRIELRNVRRGKFFRLVADVYADGTNIGLELVRAGLAVPYAGGTK